MNTASKSQSDRADETLKLAKHTEVLRPAIAARYMGISRRHLYNLADTDPRFPRKIVFSSRCVGWRREALDAYLAAKEGEA